jgi:hypothetical protein
LPLTTDGSRRTRKRPAVQASRIVSPRPVGDPERCHDEKLAHAKRVKRTTSAAFVA